MLVGFSPSSFTHLPQVAVVDDKVPLRAGRRCLALPARRRGDPSCVLIVLGRGEVQGVRWMVVYMH